MCEPSPALFGIPSEVIVAFPSVPTNAGEPVSIVLPSRRYVTPSPCPPLPVPEKPLMEPVVTAIAGVNNESPNGDPLTVTLAAETVATPLSRLSAPRHAPITGVIV